MPKKPKTIKPFYFKEMTHLEMTKFLDTEFPISLRFNEDLINKIAIRYPFLSKVKVALIVRGFFQLFRSHLIQGNILHFLKFFFNIRLHFHSQTLKGKTYPKLRTKISTPPKLRKWKKND